MQDILKLLQIIAGFWIRIRPFREKKLNPDPSKISRSATPFTGHVLSCKTWHNVHLTQLDAWDFYLYKKGQQNISLFHVYNVFNENKHTYCTCLNFLCLDKMDVMVVHRGQQTKIFRVLDLRCITIFQQICNYFSSQYLPGTNGMHIYTF